eukprot:CAMPEP_0196761392 /NCGR_PEP_ID=MMETSP1095-20130614/613_1 /TAXON_ID=96789 ORGANISM="Chromulina nebulosa, Strain UTEXLB2642" /NCGR_SAMPLE_ID=MMETSP1095 /ASSEMBLY_ACC=CAM_ASM_000446 /LENGTH=92 /DNA_ID=CAMNT_0042110871 /DNA_START=200 /DNA_END=475 /DNA_ORIENTATION=+
MPECYIRGNTIKYLRIPEEVIDLVPEQEEKELKAQFNGAAEEEVEGLEDMDEDETIQEEEIITEAEEEIIPVEAIIEAVIIEVEEGKEEEER